MDSNYKDYVLKELDNLVGQIAESTEFSASDTYKGLVTSLQGQIDYHQECIDKCKQMLLLINAGKPKVEVVSSYWSDDESEEAKAAFDDFWKSEDVMLDIKDHCSDDDDS
tara:strand:- start:68 stop:397 length:330 start_codon:yes stop_codon:yes gene_type:complete